MTETEVAKPAPVVSEKPKVRTVVHATMTNCQRVADKVEVSGLVHNRGNTTLSSVTVQTIWKDADGGILDTDLVYAVSDSDPLPPGETRSFTDATTLRKVRFCNVRALDWWASG